MKELASYVAIAYRLESRITPRPGTTELEAERTT